MSQDDLTWGCLRCLCWMVKTIVAAQGTFLHIHNDEGAAFASKEASTGDHSIHGADARRYHAFSVPTLS